MLIQKFHRSCIKAQSEIKRVVFVSVFVSYLLFVHIYQVSFLFMAKAMAECGSRIHGIAWDLDSLPLFFTR
jgi:hypothetical protein